MAKVLVGTSVGPRRCYALRMHPDKARARDPAFWTDEKYKRLVAAFQYASSVHDRAKALLSSWMLKGVGEARIDYRLTGRGKNLTLELVCDGVPTDEYYQTIVRYKNGFGFVQERVLVPGKGNGKALLRFYEFRSPKLFLPCFEGFTVLQRAVSGPMKGCESRGLRVERPVPEPLRKAFQRGQTAQGKAAKTSARGAAAKKRPTKKQPKQPKKQPSKRGTGRSRRR